MSVKGTRKPMLHDKLRVRLSNEKARRGVLKGTIAVPRALENCPHLVGIRFRVDLKEDRVVMVRGSGSLVSSRQITFSLDRGDEWVLRKFMGIGARTVGRGQHQSVDCQYHVLENGNIVLYNPSEPYPPNELVHTPADDPPSSPPRVIGPVLEEAEEGRERAPITLGWGSQNPNEQNISKQEGFNGPAPEREWWSLDAKNIELRIPAYESASTSKPFVCNEESKIEDVRNALLTLVGDLWDVVQETRKAAKKAEQNSQRLLDDWNGVSKL